MGVLAREPRLLKRTARCAGSVQHEGKLTVRGWPGVSEPRRGGQKVAAGILSDWHTMQRFLIIGLAAAILSGCCSTRDARGPSNVCEVHHTTMRTEVIRDWAGCVLPTIPYAEARRKLFPHAYPDQLSSPWPWKCERIYVCDDCVRARVEWLAKENATTLR